MSLWDYIGNIQKDIGNNVKADNVPAKNGRIPFGVSLDTAKTVKNKDGYADARARYAARSNAGITNVDIEKARVGLLTGLGKAAEFVGKVTDPFLPDLPKSVTAGVNKVLMSGAMNVRSNYAFVRGAVEDNASAGMLAMLNLLASGTTGAIAGAGVGGGIGAVAGGGIASIPAAAIGAIGGGIAGFVGGVAAGGARQRDIAKAGTFGKKLKEDAIYAESAVGQEHYNFGKEATRQLARVKGFKSLGDTSMGIGAVTSGLLNFGFEIALDPLLKGASVTGKAAKGALSGGVVPKSEGLLAGAINKATGLSDLERADRLEVDIDTLKRTGAGETTIYTPLFKFIKENDAATIRNHPTLKNNDMGDVAASILAGKTDDEISLILRIGRGDKNAIDELSSRPEYADTYSELNRYESGIEALEVDGMQFFRHDNSMLMVGKKYQDGAELIKAELEVLRGKKDFIERATNLEAWLQTDKTVSQFAWVERMRADKAVRTAALKLSGEKLGLNPLKWTEKTSANSELLNGIKQETGFGNLITAVYKNNAFSVPIHFVSRLVDDAPHATINYNEGIQSANRMRTSLRNAVAYNVIDEKEALDIMNSFIDAVDEGTKHAIVEKYTDTVIRNAAIKHGHTEDVAELAVSTYAKNHRLSKNEAISAKQENRAYMVGKDGKAIADPQLITQLANGGFLPDVAVIDKAFKEYLRDAGPAVKAARLTEYATKTALDELQSVWRGATLLRAGFTANILRDANFRAWADASMFSMYSQLLPDTLEAMSNGINTVKKIASWEKDTISPKRNLKNIRNSIDEYDKTLKQLNGRLEAEGYFKKPKKGAKPIEITPTLQRVIEYRDRVESTLAELRRQEVASVSKIPAKTIQSGKISVAGWEFNAPASGQLGQISRAQLNGKDELRGALASVRELEMETVRRGSYGGKVHHAVEDEAAHLVAWTDMLNNHLRSDPLAKKIMEGNMTKPELMNWLREDAQRSYIDRFGLTVVEEGKAPRRLRQGDAEYIVDRVNFAVDSIAANQEIRQMLLKGEISAVDLKKLYPKADERPPVSGDVTTAALGTSGIARGFVNKQKEVVAWLATQPTARLNYNHYFASKYYEKLETLVANANQRGVLPGAKERVQYEKIARSYAINEYRNKINAFSKDMNFSGIANYFIAFFPAVVEQFKAYGRIMLDNPEFPIRIAYAAELPEYIGNTQTDSYGNKYIETTMPFTGLKARWGTDWFNPINPTSGSILSASPLTTTVANFAAKRNEFAETKLGQFFLPFGVSNNSMNAYTPNTWKKTIEWVKTSPAGRKVFADTETFNKDVQMISKQYWYDFIQKNDRQPNFSEQINITNAAEKDAWYMATVRFGSAWTMPQQPKLRTAISYYQDRYSEAIKKDQKNGAENFFKDNPDYFMLADKLTNPVSGIRSDDTAVELIKRHDFATKEIVGRVGDNLTALGAIFNDDNYAFSSAAEAYLQSKNIPGLDKKFQNNQAPLESMRSAVVNKGWSDWFKLIQVVSTEIKKPPYNLDPSRGYGAVVLQQYKDAFIEQQKTENQAWWDEKTTNSAGGNFGKQGSVIKAITVAANTPAMWKDLSQQPKWHTIVEYMNFRYTIKEELDRRDVGFNTKSAIDLQNAATLKVWELRNKDVKFGQFYDRYLDGDDFSFVYDYTPPKRSK